MNVLDNGEYSMGARMGYLSVFNGLTPTSAAQRRRASISAARLWYWIVLLFWGSSQGQKIEKKKKQSLSNPLKTPQPDKTSLSH